MDPLNTPLQWRLFFFAFIFLFQSSVVTAQSLDQVYRASLEFTASIKDRRFNEEIAVEQKNQALATVRPQINAISTNTWRDEAAGVGPFGEGYQRTSFINLTQPLFQGGAEYYALSVAKNLPQIAQFEREQEELTLFTVISGFFFETLKLEKELKALNDQESTLKDRVKTLNQRAKIGRNRKTDSMAAQTQLARVMAEKSRVQRQIITAQNQLKNYTGLQQIKPIESGHGVSELSLSPGWEDQLMTNPVVSANELLAKNAEKEIKAARGSYLPNLDLDGNYYLDRAGILRDSQWDVTVNVRWNIFAGGTDSSEIRIKTLQQMQLNARLIELKNNIKNDFKALKDEFQMHQKIAQQLRSAVEFSEKNYRQHIVEANQGLVSDLEALRTLEEYLQTRRTYDQQIYDLQMTWVRLRALAGEHP